MVVTSYGANCLHIKWVYKTKRDANGKLVRYNARLVACGKEQVPGRDLIVAGVYIDDLLVKATEPLQIEMLSSDLETLSVKVG